MDLKKKHGSKTRELRELAVRLLRDGNASYAEVADELNVSVRSLQRWLRAAELPENNEPLSKAERVELEKLRKENERLREENDVLKKFDAFVASRKK